MEEILLPFVYSKARKQTSSGLPVMGVVVMGPTSPKWGSGLQKLKSGISASKTYYINKYMYTYKIHTHTLRYIYIYIYNYIYIYMYHRRKHKAEEKSLVYGEAGCAHRDEGRVGSQGRSPFAESHGDDVLKSTA